MLYVYYGSDETNVRNAALEKARTLLIPGGELSVLSGDGGSVEMLKDALGATSLFRTYEVYVLDTLSEHTELFEQFRTLAKECGTSPNQFVVIERTLLAPVKKSLEPHAAEFLEFKKTEAPYNAFALSDALLDRDKKRLWLLLQDARKEGKSEEELIGTLFWQLKVLTLVLRAPSAEAAGLKPFVYQKAERALAKYPSADLARITHALVMVYHDGHAGKRDIRLALEAWVLGL